VNLIDRKEVGGRILPRGFQGRSTSKSSRSASLTFVSITVSAASFAYATPPSPLTSRRRHTVRLRERCQSPSKNHVHVQDPGDDLYLSPIWHQTVATAEKRVRSTPRKIRKQQQLRINNQFLSSYTTKDEGKAGAPMAEAPNKIRALSSLSKNQFRAKSTQLSTSGHQRCGLFCGFDEICGVRSRISTSRSVSWRTLYHAAVYMQTSRSLYQLPTSSALLRGVVATGHGLSLVVALVKRLLKCKLIVSNVSHHQENKLYNISQPISITLYNILC